MPSLLWLQTPYVCTVPFPGAAYGLGNLTCVRSAHPVGGLV